MNADTSYLTAEEREVANLLIQAAELMQPDLSAPGIRGQSAHPRGDCGQERPGAARPLRPLMGPWDEMDEDKPFFGGAAKPVGAGFYPADLTKEQFDDYLAKHPGEAKALTDPYTVVKRQGDKLVAVPYSQ